MARQTRYLPVLSWAQEYDKKTLGDDLLAAVIVTIMLVPQSLAYALLAGLPPEAGLYASIVPIMLYAVFGTSKTLAVGPVAVISLMTATTIGAVAEQGTADYATAALLLAFLSGAFLVVMGLLRLGFLANFLSHPVISGFITASGILIALSQLKHLLGISTHGHTLPDVMMSTMKEIASTNLPTLLIGAASIGFLLWVRRYLKSLLVRVGIGLTLSDMLAKAGPVGAVIATTLVVWMLQLDNSGTGNGVAIVGDVPAGLPPFSTPPWDLTLIRELALPAILISVIGFVESVSVAQTLAAKRRERIDPDQELIGLGAANIGSAFTGGFPVTGGFSRSVVNFDAGARTPAAGAFTAIGLLIATVFLTPLIYYLPKATLAATIIVAVISLVDFSILKKAWRYSKADFSAVAVTILVTLLSGVEAGVSTGVAVSVFLHLYKTSRPHMAIVGRVPGTEHFRNIHRHEVETSPHLLSLRVDESLYFANARYLEDQIYDMVAARPELKHVILQCNAINAIDFSALESLETINDRLKTLGVGFHLSEVKGPVMDRLKREHFLEHLNGKVFLSHHEAVLQVG